MDTSIIVALIMSGISILLAVWALLTAKSARKRVLEAEIEVKHKEEIWTKEFEAISILKDCVVDYMRKIESALILFNSIKDINNEIFRSIMAEGGTSYSELINYALKNAPYLPNEINASISKWDINALKQTPNINEIMFFFLRTRFSDVYSLYTRLLTIFEEKYIHPKN